MYCVSWGDLQVAWKTRIILEEWHLVGVALISKEKSVTEIGQSSFGIRMNWTIHTLNFPGRWHWDRPRLTGLSCTSSILQGCIIFSPQTIHCLFRKNGNILICHLQVHFWIHFAFPKQHPSGFLRIKCHLTPSEYMLKSLPNLVSLVLCAGYCSCVIH